MVKALYVANTFLKCGFNENIDISPMKLQKLIYILYKEYLQSTGKKLFEESFSVWKYGPVLVSVYNEFESYQSKPIKEFYFVSDQYMTVDFNSSDDFKAVFDNVWETYKNFDGVSLSALTHSEDTAWDKARIRNDEYLLDLDILEEFSYEERF
ncbi:MAG: DUF4065 domain-containing protein [Peptoniphilaceae bacterium]|uniref:Panacea domain-containing protein n=1 Tax=Parvimonas sp. TaxID=1944660 RepID=UPI0025E5667C|nr:type II toxin-antitoxin system antitoxin SocA domain-containing protein [Parvimonas sp.]MCI5997986.1 DUF4065 domain-containing protein [Parvimonas sp.]MDD7764428.1 DUF4065 domain-containing protein [Peptoniphilaceae bacterium]MDY3051362.1 DUF4065 domain-containing protein [Parvimonas sp.]